jgi:hypothetical protein
MRVRPPPPAPLVLVPKAYPADAIREQDEGRGAAYLPAFFRLFLVLFAIAPLIVLFTDYLGYEGVMEMVRCAG